MAILLLATTVAYHNTFSVPFLFDDRASILDNPTIRHLWPLTIPLSPPSEHGYTVSGRPLVNLSLALNYAISGTHVWSYHALNLAIHLLAGLTLFGLTRRTLERPAPLATLQRPVRSSKERSNIQISNEADLTSGLSPAARDQTLEDRSAPNATLVALAIALLWLVHPLQTESVTYIVQRSESLMGLFYLLTLYCFVRSVEAANRRRWQVAAIGACIAGMASKEVMGSAPLIVFLYDRTFVAGSFRAAWQARRGVHLALAGSWLLLVALVASTGGNRGGTMGFDVGREWIPYWLAQGEAVVRYLRLTFWPHPLVFDYGPATGDGVASVWLPVLLVTALIFATVIALARFPRAGFLATWFVCVLAPTSLVPGQMQTIVEHRMYLPLAALIGLVVTLAVFHFGRRTLSAFFALAAISAIVTTQRNADYRSEVSLWTDTVAHRPANASAHINLGAALLAAGHSADAVAAFEGATRLQPDSPIAQANLASAFLRLGRFDRAREHGENAVRIDPVNVDARVNLGLALASLDRPADAVAQFERALELQPGAADVHAHLAAALVRLGRMAPATDHYRAALQLDPTDAATWYALGNVQASTGQLAEAVLSYRRALELEPGFIAARNNLANALLMSGETIAAIAQYEHILRERPDDAAVRENLARARELHTSSRPRP